MDKKAVAVVTGCSRGIGKAIAAKLHSCGFEIYAFASSAESVKDESPYRWFFADLADEDSLRSALEAMPADMRIDVIINNAGINRIKEIADVSQEDYEAVLNVNTKAPYFIIQKLLPLMHPGGRIVNIASIWSVNTKAGRSLYSASKAALAGMTRALAAELAPRNILVNCISPGFTRTDLTESSLTKKEKTEIVKNIPLGRMAEVEEIANLAAFLTSNENTYITGQNILIDGGFTIV